MSTGIEREIGRKANLFAKPLNDVLHRWPRKQLRWLAIGAVFKLAWLTEDHRYAAARDMRKHLLSFGIELHAVILQRMRRNRPGLMVRHENDRRRRRRSVVGPFDVTTENVLGTLQPLKADHGNAGRLGLAALDAPPGELIYLFARDSWFCRPGPSFERDAEPRIRDLSIELIWKKAMDDTPSLAATLDDLFRRPRASSVRPGTAWNSRVTLSERLRIPNVAARLIG